MSDVNQCCSIKPPTWMSQIDELLQMNDDENKVFIRSPTDTYIPEPIGTPAWADRTLLQAPTTQQKCDNDKAIWNCSKTTLINRSWPRSQPEALQLTTTGWSSNASKSVCPNKDNVENVRLVPLCTPPPCNTTTAPSNQRGSGNQPPLTADLRQVGAIFHDRLCISKFLSLSPQLRLSI